MPWSERLSGLDAVFLLLEDATAHMHVGAVGVLDGPAPPLDALRALVASRIARQPRFRQKLAQVPLGLAHPVWVDDAQFELEGHVRRIAVDAPGDAAALDRAAGRHFGQPLVRGRPLWEVLLADGLADGSFGLVLKVHHCMVDGTAGMELASLFFDRDPAARPEPPPPWAPRPAPTPAELARAALVENAERPAALGRRAVNAPPEDVLRRAAGVVPLLRLAGLQPAPPSPFNGPLGPRRRYRRVTLDLAEVKATGKRLGGTVNDVLLAVVTGGLRALLLETGATPPPALRALVPVSVRAPDAAGVPGNQVSAIFCALPVGAATVADRAGAVLQETARLKASGQALGTHLWVRLADLAPPAVVGAVARHQVNRGYVNLTVTNVRGPAEPVYLLGRRLRAWHPLVPLAPGLTLSVAITSYAGAVGLGLVSDADRPHDLDGLAAALHGELAALGRLPPAAPGR